MQLRNIEPFSQYVPGDVVEVPDGAQFDPFHWEAVAAPPPPPAGDGTAGPAAAPVQFLNPDPKEM